VGRRGRPAPGPRARRAARPVAREVWHNPPRLGAGPARARSALTAARVSPEFPQPAAEQTGPAPPHARRPGHPACSGSAPTLAPGARSLPRSRPQPRRPTTPVPAVAATTSPGRRRLRTSRRKLLSAAPRHRSLEGRSSAGGRRDRDDQHQQRRRPGGPHARTPARPRTPRPGAPGGVAAPEALPSCTLGAVSRSSGRTCGHQRPGRRGDPR
jgi:hypothetical protein